MSSRALTNIVPPNMEGFNGRCLQNGSKSSTFNPPLLDPEEFRKQGHMMIDFLADYYKNVEKYPVRSQVQPGYLAERLPASAPISPESLETILQDVQMHIIPGITHWQSPNHFAYFPSSGSTAAFLGEMLSTGLNVVGFNWISSPAATELESVVMDWLGQMLQLPESFLFSGGGGGVLQGTTCEALLCTLTAARDRILGHLGLGRDGILKLVVYGSDQTHFSLQKACRIAGISPENIRLLSTNKSNAFQLSSESLESAIVSDVEAGLTPLFLCATVGTTSSAAVDPLRPLCAVAKRQGLWVHVDAAYAGSSCILPELRHFLDGVEGANSLSLNAHKWLFTNLDCCCLWVKDPNALIKALSTNPECLRNKATESKQVVDYKDWQIALSRRFRAMKLWLVLRSHGVYNLSRFIRCHISMAKQFEELVKMDQRFEVVVPRNFAVVCFRVSPSACGLGHDDMTPSEQSHANQFNSKLLESINGSGQIYMSHALLGGVFVIRFAVGASLTGHRHVSTAWKVVQDHATAMLRDLN